MPTLYTVSIAVHVMAAVLALGVVGAIPLTARLARRSDTLFAGAENILGTLLRTTQVGLGTMVLTGVLLDVSAAGAFHRAGWFKVSIAVLVVVGVSFARARAALRQSSAPGGGRESALGRVERWGWVMCASVGLITLLMQTKPFP